MAGDTPKSVDQPQEAKASIGAWWMLGVLFLLYLFSFLDRMVISILVPAIQADLGLSDTQMSLILGPGFALSYAVFGLPLGWASDRYSRRWVIFLGVCVFGLATGASGLANGFVALLAARMFVGVGEASLSPAAYSLLADRFPKRLLTMAINIYTMGIKIGSATALALGGFLVSTVPAEGIVAPFVGHLLPWHVVMLICGLPAIPLALLVFTFKEPPRKALAPLLEGEERQGLMPFIRSEWRLVVPILVGFGLIGIMGSGMNAWIPTYMARAFGWTPGQYGPMLGALNLACSFSLILTAAIIDWLYAKGVRDAHLRFYVWMLAASLPIMGVMFFIKVSWIFLALFWVFLVVATPIVGYASAILQLISPAHLRGQMTAVFLFILTVIGGSLGPVLVATITDVVFRDEARLGYSLAVVALTVCPMALGLLILALRPLRARLSE